MTFHANLQSKAANPVRAMTTPTVVEDALDSPGQPLENTTRSLMESRFDQNFSHVRIHTGKRAVQSAKRVHARAYTVGQHLVFGHEQYEPTSASGRRLLAHELTHVAQQQQNTSSVDAEKRADLVANRVGQNQAVTPAMIGGAPVSLQAQDSEETEPVPAEEGASEVRPAFSVRWLDIARTGGFQLTPPALLQSPTTGFSPGSVSLSPALQAPLLSSPTTATSAPSLPPPTLIPPTSETTPEGPDLTSPTPSPEGEEASGADMPSRVSVADFGQFTLGLRLGLPELDLSSPEGMPPSALQASLARGTFINQMLTGNVPSGWEAVDKGKLARAIWGIVSTNIAPDLARSITSGLSTSTPAGTSGTSYELDLALITNFSNEIGGGLSFTVRFNSFHSLFTGRP